MINLKNRSFTLTEILVTVVIAGTVATFAMYASPEMREKALDNEARMVAKEGRAAWRIYNIETNLAPVCSNLAEMNTILRLSLPVSPSWNYEVDNNGCVQATRNGDDGRVWRLEVNEPNGEPVLGTCP